MPPQPVFQPLTLAIVNDYQVVVEGLARMLEPFTDRVRIVERVAGEPSRERADVALYDTFAARSAFAPDVNADHLVLWTIRTSPDFTMAALTNGAHGVLSKSIHATELVDALERICAGEIVITEGERQPCTSGDWPGRPTGLSEREAEILALVCSGMSNEKIGEALYLSINTVKSYIRTAYRKMGVASRSQAVLWGIEHGFAQHSPTIARQPAGSHFRLLKSQQPFDEERYRRGRLNPGR